LGFKAKLLLKRKKYLFFQINDFLDFQIK